MLCACTDAARIGHGERMHSHASATARHAITAQTRALTGARAPRAHTHIYKNEDEEEEGRGRRIRLYVFNAIKCFEFVNKLKTYKSKQQQNGCHKARNRARTHTRT